MNVIAINGDIPVITRFSTTLYRVEVGDYVGCGNQVSPPRLVKVVEVLDDRLIVERPYGRQEFWLRGGVAVLVDEDRGHTDQVWPIHENLYKDILHFREQDILFNRLRESVKAAADSISGALVKPREHMTMSSTTIDQLIELLNQASKAIHS